VAFLSERWTYKSIKVVLAAIRSQHVDAGVACDMEGMLRLKRVCDGVRRSKGEGLARTRLPVTVKLISKMVTVLNWRLYDDRLFMAIVCVGTYGLLRSGEMFPDASLGQVGLRWSDVVATKDRLSLRLATSKTDPWRKGATVELFRNNTMTCPLKAWHNYANHFATKPNPDENLFLNQERKPVNKTWIVAYLREVITKLGLNPSHYSGHSFRKGGATSLADAGVQDSVIKEMGRWKSGAYQLYIGANPTNNFKASMRMAAIGSRAGLEGNSSLQRKQ